MWPKHECRSDNKRSLEPPTLTSSVMLSRAFTGEFIITTKDVLPSICLVTNNDIAEQLQSNLY